MGIHSISHKQFRQQVAGESNCEVARVPTGNLPHTGFSNESSIFDRSEIFTQLSYSTMSIGVGVESVHRGFGGAPVRSRCWSLPAPVALGYPDAEEA